MIPFKIAIPSYKRANTLLSHTLTLLEDANILKSSVSIFLSGEAELSAYDRVLPNHWANRCKMVDAHGMGAVRNAISDYYREGEFLVEMDDDLKGIYNLTKDNGGLMAIGDELKAVIEHGFELCVQTGTRLWGVYPVKNPYFMRGGVRTKIAYIVGAFFGVINTHDRGLYVTLDDKEDFERSIKYYQRFGKLVRLEDICVETAYYTEPGGMQETRTEDRVKRSALYLLKKYPQFCTVNRARKKHFEIKLVDKR
jgi:hypothetical protein